MTAKPSFGGGSAAWATLVRQSLASTTVAACGSVLVLSMAAMSANAVSGFEPAPPADTSVKVLYWGDVHLHSNLSFDAYINGTHLIGPEQAYRFARGERVMSNTGLPVQRQRPLDFLAITDHSENMGLYARIDARDPLIVGTPVAERYTEILTLFNQYGLRGAFMRSLGAKGPLPSMSNAARESIWQQVAKLADRYNQPGTFSTLIGYEWTSMITGDNLHRVVLYRDDANKVTRRLPLDASADPDPESLWTELEQYENETGGNVLAIAHNGNLSNGRMFAPTRVNGEPIDAAYAARRARWEPVYEVTQVKGDGETHPALSPDDPFADFETWDYGNVAGTAPKASWMLSQEYARQALMAGLAHEQNVGVNPFRFGLIGSTDSHTGLSATHEANFLGKFAGSEPSAARLQSRMAGMKQFDRELSASGLIAVWASENTRTAIFDAIRNREVYATTGSRIALRVFGGWDYAPEDLEHPKCLLNGCARGVPMGQPLPATATTGSPRLLIGAYKDPDGAHLERVQVVKGWIDTQGKPRERVYDVVRYRHTLDDASSTTTDSTTADNSRGATALTTCWQDPDFDPSAPAFYYVRVLEVPSARWTTEDAARYAVPLPDDVPERIQDRAYSSPIWYQPPTVD